MKEIVHPPPTRKPIDLLEHGGKWIAIWRREIIDSDADGDKLIERIRERGLEGKAGIMGVPRPGVRRL